MAHPSDRTRMSMPPLAFAKWTTLASMTAGVVMAAMYATGTEPGRVAAAIFAALSAAGCGFAYYMACELMRFRDEVLSISIGLTLDGQAPFDNSDKEDIR